MSETGGVMSRTRIYVEDLSAIATKTRIEVYEDHSINRVAVNTSDNGYTVLIIPAFSTIHEKYALEAVSYEGMFLKTVSGWISGTHLDDTGKAPQVFDGRTGAVFADRAVAMHVELPPGKQAQLGIVNIFEPGDGDELEFSKSGFTVEDCLINGQGQNFEKYIQKRGIDTRLPLIANYMGTSVNVSIRSTGSGRVRLYAPVFDGVKYRFAKPIVSYTDHFDQCIPQGMSQPAFSCNCILNYLYGSLEGRRTGAILGPMTFGEIGYQLLNQTLVYVSLIDV